MCSLKMLFSMRFLQKNILIIIRIDLIIVRILYIPGGYPESNRELTVPHTVVLPIELYPPLLCRGDSNTHK
jgi:hypothetical protein